MIKAFIYYFLISGVLAFFQIYYKNNFSKKKEELRNEIAELSWTTGVKEELIEVLAYSMSLVFGWVLLPYKLLRSVFKWED